MVVRTFKIITGVPLLLLGICAISGTQPDHADFGFLAGLVGASLMARPTILPNFQGMVFLGVVWMAVLLVHSVSLGGAWLGGLLFGWLVGWLLMRDA